MTNRLATYIIEVLIQKGIHFETGLTDEEVEQVETVFKIQFPTDLKLFLQTALPTSDRFVNWRLGLHSPTEAEKIDSRLNWPLEGMLFDLQDNEFWIKSWGDRPATYAEKQRIATEKYQRMPQLIPIYSHRYIPARPGDSGNPVFSVHQMDIIYYGYDLATYFANEFNLALPGWFKKPDRPKRKIEFWSPWVDDELES